MCWFGILQALLIFMSLQIHNSGQQQNSGGKKRHRIIATANFFPGIYFVDPYKLETQRKYVLRKFNYGWLTEGSAVIFARI